MEEWEEDEILNVDEKINGDHYKNKLEFPTSKDIYSCSKCGIVNKKTNKFCNDCGNKLDDNLEKKYNEATKTFREETGRLNELFKQDAIIETGLDEYEDEMVDRAYTLAWRNGHAYGLSEVLMHFEEIAHVITGE